MISNNFSFLIISLRTRDLYLNIIFRPTLPTTILIFFKQNHMFHSSIFLDKLCSNLLPFFDQNSISFFFKRFRNLIFKISCRNFFSESMCRKRESMKFCNFKIFHSPQSFLKIFLRLSWKSSNQICTNGNKLRMRSFQTSNLF